MTRLRLGAAFFLVIFYCARANSPVQRNSEQCCHHRYQGRPQHHAAPIQPVSHNLFHSLLVVRSTFKPCLEGLEARDLDPNNDGHVGYDCNVSCPQISRCPDFVMLMTGVSVIRLMGLVQNFAGLFAARFFLAVAEVSGIPLLLR